MSRHNPLGVSPKALCKLPAAKKEQVLSCQQRFEPLPLNLQKALDRVKEGVDNKH